MALPAAMIYVNGNKAIKGILWQPAPEAQPSIDLISQEIEETAQGAQERATSSPEECHAEREDLGRAQRQEARLGGGEGRAVEPDARGEADRGGPPWSPDHPSDGD